MTGMDGPLTSKGVLSDSGSKNTFPQTSSSSSSPTSLVMPPPTSTGFSASYTTQMTTTILHLTEIRRLSQAYLDFCVPIYHG